MARKASVKKNPLKNNQVLFRLNPFAQTEKRIANAKTPETHEKIPKKKIVYRVPAVPGKTKEERKAERLAAQAAQPKAVKVPKVKKEPKVETAPLPEVIVKDPIVQPEVASEPIVESEVEAEPIVELEVESEPVVEPEVESEPVVEPEVESEPVVEPEVESEPVVEPEVESEPVVEPEVESEPVVEPEVESEPVVEPEVMSEPVVEGKVESEPEIKSLEEVDSLHKLAVKSEPADEYVTQDADLDTVMQESLDVQNQSLHKEILDEDVEETVRNRPTGLL